MIHHKGGHKFSDLSLEAVLLTCIVDANKNRDVDIVDILNAFVQTIVKDEKNKGLICIRGPLVDILVSIAPNVYGLYVMVGKKGEKKLLVQWLTALYGTMVASLLLQEVRQEFEVQGIQA
jgi:hypothetical protein